MSKLTWNGTAEFVLRNQNLRRERGQRNIHFPYSADYEQDWQPYPVDPYHAICDEHTYIHSSTHTSSPLPPKPGFGVWVWEGLSGGCRARLNLERCSQLAAFVIRRVGWDAASVWLAEDGVPRCAPLPSSNLVFLGRMAARERQGALSRRVWWCSLGWVRTRFGESGGQIDRRRTRGGLNSRTRESRAWAGRFLREKLMPDHGHFSSYEGHKERRTDKIRVAFSRMHRALNGWILARAPASLAQCLHHGPRYFNFSYFCTMRGLEKLGLDQNWLERNLTALLLRTLVVGRLQQAESIEATLGME